MASGTPARQVAREHGSIKTALYRWKRVYGGMRPGEPKWLLQLKEEKRRLKRIALPTRRQSH